MTYQAMVAKATGDVITESEWDKIKENFDTAFPLGDLGLGSAFTTWTPTFSNMTVGNGTTTYARYMRLGRLIWFEIRFQFGSTSAFGTVPTFTVPVQSASRYNDNSRDLFGEVLIFDAGTAGYRGSLMWRSNTTAGLLVMAAGGTYVNHVDVTATIPIATTASGDTFMAKGWYEAAN
jgi:hypothetical protein